MQYDGSNLTAGQRAINKAISSVRITVEWVFEELKQYFNPIDNKRKMKVMQAPVGTLYNLAIHLTNIRTYLYRNPTSSYFACAPPSLDEYIQTLDQ